ncbi:MAG: sensor histidine kinase [Clostridia bacterium]|nr:sensor histidine kinase [Clostridia bacterium]MBN2881998.1 sensor histidine kinase [Clostridia bacterium]
MNKVELTQHKSIKTKLLVTVVVGILLFFVVIVINNRYAVKLIEERLGTITDNMADLSREYMDLRIRKSNNISMELSLDEEVVLLSSNYLAESDSYKSLSDIKDSVTDKLVEAADINEEIDSIYMYYASRRSLVASNGEIQRSNEPEIRGWVEANTGWNSEVKWFDYFSGVDNKNYLSMMYRLDYLNEGIRTPVYLGINYDKNAIYDFLGKIKLTKNSMAALINFNDDVFVLNSDIEILVDFKTKVRNNSGLLKNEGTALVDLQGMGSVFLKYTPLSDGSGGIVHIIPDDDLRPFKKNLQPLIFTIALALSLGFVMMLWKFINSDVVKPTEKLIQHMKKLEEGRFSDKIEDVRRDEFGRVFTAYNNMSEEIENLIQELYQEKLVKREMELKILQEKINPHFLYNTLDTINWIAREHNVEDISKMVIALSTMYRKTFNKGRDLISIKDVMTSIACYLDIQQIRYGDAFDYSITCDEGTENLEILNLIIQTLVENAIVHGIEGMSGKGKIEINTSRNGSFLTVTVTDNGAGITKEKLDLIRTSINASGMESESGLRNVQKRIKLYYGNKYGIELFSESSIGTKVKVTIPAREATDD